MPTSPEPLEDDALSNTDSTPRALALQELLTQASWREKQRLKRR